MPNTTKVASINKLWVNFIASSFAIFDGMDLSKAVFQCIYIRAFVRYEREEKERKRSASLSLSRSSLSLFIHLSFFLYSLPLAAFKLCIVSTNEQNKTFSSYFIANAQFFVVPPNLVQLTYLACIYFFEKGAFDEKERMNRLDST